METAQVMTLGRIMCKNMGKYDFQYIYQRIGSSHEKLRSSGKSMDGLEFQQGSNA